MGANLLIVSIGFKAQDRCLIDEPWARSAFAQARRAIEAFDEARLAQINAENNYTYDDLQDCKETLLGDLAEVETAVLGEHRQAAAVEGGGGVILLLSGGLSWGDAPTELFDSMARLIEAEVLPDARWPDPQPTAGQAASP